MASIRPVPQSPINADTSSCIETTAAPGGGAAAATTARAQTNKRASLQAQRNPRPSDHRLQSPTTSSTTSTAAALLQEAIHNLCPPLIHDEDNAHNPNPADHLPTLASSNRNSETMAENDLASRSPPINGLPPPFLTKTYDIVDDPCTDGIVSWARGGGSFVVWDLHAFSAQLLPKFFKHNNYSSFVRQLNTYGFRKVDPDRWEFANDGFVRGHKYLLKLIQRRKTHHQSTLVCTVPCATEMVGNDMVGVHGSRPQCELFESMKRDKDFLMMEIIRLRQHQQSTLQEMKAMLDRLRVTEHRQHQMVAFLARAIQNPAFMAQLVQKNEMSKGLKTIKKKRCLPNSMCNIGSDFDDAAEESRVSETADSSKTTAKMDVQISGYGHEALDVDNPDSDKLLEFLEPDVDVESAHLEALLQEMGHTTTKQDCTEGKLKPHMSALPHAAIGNMLDAEIGQGLSQGAQFGFSGIAKKGENPHSLEDIGLLEAGDIDVLWEQLMLGVEDDSKVNGKRATRGCNQCRYASNSM